MRRVKYVRVLEGFRLSLAFDDGRTGTVDLAHLAGKGVFALWLDRKTFESVGIGPSGELVWADRIDLCPDALYLKATGQAVSALFPAAPAEPARA